MRIVLVAPVLVTLAVRARLGFGFSLTLVPLASLLIGFSEAVLLAIVLEVISGTAMAVEHRTRLRLLDAALMKLCSLGGLLAGVLLHTGGPGGHRRGSVPAAARQQPGPAERGRHRPVAVARARCAGGSHRAKDDDRLTTALLPHWEFHGRDWITAVEVVEDQFVFVGSRDGTLWILNRHGSELANLHLGSWIGALRVLDLRDDEWPQALRGLYLLLGTKSGLMRFLRIDWDEPRAVEWTIR